MTDECSDKFKYIRVKFSDGSEWDIDAYLILHNKLERQRRAFQTSEERGNYIQYLYDNPEILVDWAMNNMDWRDVKDRAKKVTMQRPTDYDLEWPHAEKTIVLKDKFQ